MRRSKKFLKNVKKNPVKFTLEGLLFSTAIKNKTGKIFVTTNRLIDAKYILINGNYIKQLV